MLFFIIEALNPIQGLYAGRHHNVEGHRYHEPASEQECAIKCFIVLGVGVLVTIIATCSLGLCKPSDHANMSPRHLNAINASINNTNVSMAAERCSSNSTNATKCLIRNSTASFKGDRLQNSTNRQQLYDKRNN